LWRHGTEIAPASPAVGFGAPAPGSCLHDCRRTDSGGGPTCGDPDTGRVEDSDLV